MFPERCWRKDVEDGSSTRHQELFEFYLLERFLYRLSASPYHDRFVLKGGLLLSVLSVRRPTRDADMLAWGVAGDEENLLAVIREVVSIPVDDGMTFDVSQARATTIREHAAYPGIRIVIPVALGAARLWLASTSTSATRWVHRRSITRPCSRTSR